MWNFLQDEESGEFFPITPILSIIDLLPPFKQ